MRASGVVVSDVEGDRQRAFGLGGEAVADRARKRDDYRAATNLYDRSVRIADEGDAPDPGIVALLVRAGVDPLDANDRRALRRVLAALGA